MHTSITNIGMEGSYLRAPDSRREKDRRDSVTLKGSRRRYGMWCIVLILTVVSSTTAANEPRRVLLLHSFGRDLTPLDVFAMNLPPEVDRRYGPTTFYDVTLQPASFSQLPQEKPIVDYLVSTVSGQKQDLVVTVGGPAAVFALKYRQQLFPAIPM